MFFVISSVGVVYVSPERLIHVYCLKWLNLV